MENVFLRVLNLSITAGYIVLAVVIMRLLLRRAPRWISCALWTLVAVRLVCPVSLESAWSLIPSAETVSPAILETANSADRPVIHSGFEVIDQRANAALEDMIPPEAPRLVSIDPENSLVPVRSPAKSLAYIASVVWLAGMALMLLYGLVSYLHMRRRVATAVWWTGSIWQCETVTTPFVLGFFRPRIYLPFSMDRETAEHVIAHEQAHIRRRDHLSKSFGYLLLAVYWFNPLLWLAYILFGKDIELACDERVIRTLSPSARRRYALALLECGTGRPVLPACPLAFGEVGVKERILRVMKYKRPAIWAMALALILCAAAAVCLLTNPRADAMESVSQTFQTPAVEEAVAYEPEIYTGTFTSADGVITYNMEAEIYDVPDTVPILQVRPREITVEEAQNMVKAIFGDAEIYEYSYERTRAEMEPIIEDLRATVREFETDFESKVDYYHDAAHGMTREEAEELARSVQADFEDRLATMEALYETASDAVTPQPCAWEYHPWSYYQDPSLFGGSTAIDAGGHRYIKARAYMNGYPYTISLCNKDANPGDNYRIHDVSVYIDDSIVDHEVIWGATEPFTQEDIDATLATAEQLLAAMGLDNYAVASWEGGQGYALNVTAAPVYEGTRLVTTVGIGGAINADIPGSYGGSNAWSECVTFSFLSPDLLRDLEWQTPHEVVARQDVESILPFSQAIDAFAQVIGAATVPAIDPENLPEGVSFYTDEFMYAMGDTDSIQRNVDRIDFGYVRLPIGDGTGDFQLIPAYCFSGTVESEWYTEDGESYTDSQEYLYAVISAVDGSSLQY